MRPIGRTALYFLDLRVVLFENRVRLLGRCRGQHVIILRLGARSNSEVDPYRVVVFLFAFLRSRVPRSLIIGTEIDSLWDFAEGTVE